MRSILWRLSCGNRGGGGSRKGWRWSTFRRTWRWSWCPPRCIWCGLTGARTSARRRAGPRRGGAIPGRCWSLKHGGLPGALDVPSFSFPFIFPGPQRRTRAGVRQSRSAIGRTKRNGRRRNRWIDLFTGRFIRGIISVRNFAKSSRTVFWFDAVYY